jgi:hypothetical protein
MSLILQAILMELHNEKLALFQYDVNVSDVT